MFGKEASKLEFGRRLTRSQKEKSARRNSHQGEVKASAMNAQGCSQERPS